MSTRRRILVTEATGYVGGRLLRELLDRGEGVRGTAYVLGREPERFANR